MAEQIINNGASAGDPTAENIYTSFEKSKDNFSELYALALTFLAKAGGIMTGILEFANGTANAPSAKIGTDQKGLYHEGTDKLGISISSTKVGEFNSNGYAGLVNRIALQDRKTAGTSGGTATPASWNVRDINTVLVNNITGASLGVNNFTLPIGRYYIKNISAVAYAVNSNQIRLYNITNSQTQNDINSSQILGTAEYSSSTGICSTKSTISGVYFDVTTSAKVFRVDHYVANSTSVGDFGTEVNVVDEIYLNIEIEKVG